MTVRGMLAVALLCGALVSCGEPPPHIPQISSQPPFATDHVSVRQTGDAPAVVDTTTVSVGRDAAGLLVLRFQLRSTASAPQTVAARATLRDPAGDVVGDASGNAVAVPPGAVVPVHLSGPSPTGTIASAVVELSVPR